MHRIDAGCVAACACKQSVLDVFINRQGQKIAWADHIGIGDACIQEGGCEAKRFDNRCGLRHARVHFNDESITFALHGTCENFVAIGPDTGKAAGSKNAHHDQECDCARTSGSQ